MLTAIVHTISSGLFAPAFGRGVRLLAQSSANELALPGEKELVKKAKKGDNGAFTELYNHYFPKVYSYLIRRTGHQQTAEDLTSQVFLKAFSKLPTFTITTAPFGAWIFRIAFHTLTDHYRKNARAKEELRDTLPDMRDDARSAHEEFMSEETKEQVLSLVARLSPKDRQMVEMRFLAELSVKEISAIVELSPNVISVRIYRALKKLQGMISENEL